MAGAEAGRGPGSSGAGAKSSVAASMSVAGVRLNELRALRSRLNPSKPHSPSGAFCCSGMNAATTPLPRYPSTVENAGLRGGRGGCSGAVRPQREKRPQRYRLGVAEALPLAWSLPRVGSEGEDVGGQASDLQYTASPENPISKSP